MGKKHKAKIYEKWYGESYHIELWRKRARKEKGMTGKTEPNRLASEVQKSQLFPLKVVKYHD